MAKEEWVVAVGESRIIDLGNIEKLKTALIGGHIDVIGHDEPGARVEVTGVSGKELRVSIENGRLVVDHPQLAWDNFIAAFGAFRGKAKAEVSILVPRSVKLNLGVVSAEALVAGMHGDANLSTVSGTVLVDRCTGELQLNAVRGDITVRAHRGTVQAHTVSGELALSGDISKITVNSVSADLFADLTGYPEKLRSNAVSGSLTLRLPARVPVNYTVNTVSGRLQLDSTEFRGVKGGFSGRWAQGAQDGVSALELRANSVSGDVVVLHGRPGAAEPGAAPEAAAASAPSAAEQGS